MNKLFSNILGTGLLLLATAPSHGITLSFEPASQDLTVGSSTDVAVVISGLGDGTAPSLGTFDLDISFDPAVLAFSSVAFGPFLGDPSLGEAIRSFDDSVSGVVNLFELSLLEADSATCIFCIPPFLDDLQPASFTLATLTFNALSTGASALGISINALGDAFADPLTADIQGGSVRSTSTVTIPEPSSLLLLGIGLLGLGRFRGKWVQQA